MRYLLGVLYVVSLVGISLNLITHHKILGIVGYTALGIACIIQIFKLLREKHKNR